MLTKEEIKEKKNFKVNFEEYNRILTKEPISLIDYEEWSIFYKSVAIHKNLNNLFESNTFLYRLVMTDDYSKLIKDKNQQDALET